MTLRRSKISAIRGMSGLKLDKMIVGFTTPISNLENIINLHRHAAEQAKIFGYSPIQYLCLKREVNHDSKRQ